jgi:seryl-tRNA synthetase
MLDIKFVRENSEKVKKGVAAKQFDPAIVDKVLELDKKRRNLLQETERLRAERNKISKDNTEGARKRGKEIKENLKKLEPELRGLEKEYKDALYKVPNLAADDVKVGKDESENEVVRKWGEPTKFDFKPKDHLELGETLDIIDVKRAAKVSGTRFGYLKGDAVLLEFALVQFSLETLIKEGFIPVVPPVLIKKDAMSGMGYLEHGGEEDMYVLEKDNLVLVGTSEQSIGPMHRDEVFRADELPKRYVGFSACLRREAGSWGKDTRGILRVHHFDKVEMFSFCKAESSDKEHEYLLSLQEKLFQAMNIPYQVVKMCTGDLGAPAARKYDLDVWLPSQGKYREVTSTSNATDFQARRLNIKYQEKGESRFVHTLNGTAFAISRTIIAILENYQQKNGSVVVPEVLRKWVDKDKIERS